MAFYRSSREMGLSLDCHPYQIYVFFGTVLALVFLSIVALREQQLRGILFESNIIVHDEFGWLGYYIGGFLFSLKTLAIYFPLTF